jgi:outer membrane protein TolC
VGQVDYDIRRTANLIQQAKDQLRLSLINLYNTKKNLETQINIYKNLVQVAKNNLRTAQIRYREGSLDYLSMRNIEIQFNGVSLQYNQFLFNYLINKTEILHLIGQVSVENN